MPTSNIHHYLPLIDTLICEDCFKKMELEMNTLITLDTIGMNEINSSIKMNACINMNTGMKISTGMEMNTEIKIITRTKMNAGIQMNIGRKMNAGYQDRK